MSFEIIKLEGMLNLDNQKLIQKTISDSIDNNPNKHIFLDLKEVTHMGSTFISVLIRSARQLNSLGNGKILIIYNLNAFIKQVAEIVNLVKFIGICETKEDAIDHINKL